MNRPSLGTLSPPKKGRSQYWSWTYRVDGKSKTESLKVRRKHEAVAERSRRMAEYSERRGDENLTVGSLLSQYQEYATGYYRDPSGSPTSTMFGIKEAVATATAHSADIPVLDFGPNRLRELRQVWLDRNVSRTTVNAYVGIVRRAFKWAAGREMMPITVYQALMAVEGLRKGRSEARENAPVAPVPDDHVRKVKANVGDEVSTVIDLQLHTAARPSELLSLKPTDIDTSGPVWIATVEEHKTAHHGKGRELYLGPKAQEIIRPYLVDTPVHERLFEYTVAGYRRAITRACERCGVPHWTPHRLRHNAATAIRKRYGVEAAQVMLGHSGLGVTQVYAEKNREHGLRIAGEIG